MDRIPRQTDFGGHQGGSVSVAGDAVGGAAEHGDVDRGQIPVRQAGRGRRQGGIEAEPPGQRQSAEPEALHADAAEGAAGAVAQTQQEGAGAGMVRPAPAAAARQVGHGAQQAVEEAGHGQAAEGAAQRVGPRAASVAASRQVARPGPRLVSRLVITARKMASSRARAGSARGPSSVGQMSPQMGRPARPWSGPGGSRRRRKFPLRIGHGDEGVGRGQRQEGADIEAVDEVVLLQEVRGQEGV